jgi:hypothetical protein
MNILTPFFIAYRSLSFFWVFPLFLVRPHSITLMGLFLDTLDSTVLLDSLSTALLPSTGDPWDQPLF